MTLMYLSLIAMTLINLALVWSLSRVQKQTDDWRNLYYKSKTQAADWERICEERGMIIRSLASHADVQIEQRVLH